SGRHHFFTNHRAAEPLDHVQARIDFVGTVEVGGERWRVAQFHQIELERTRQIRTHLRGRDPAHFHTARAERADKRTGGATGAESYGLPILDVAHGGVSEV